MKATTLTQKTHGVYWRSRKLLIVGGNDTTRNLDDQVLLHSTSFQMSLKRMIQA
jgi:hypothetical protein